MVSAWLSSETYSFDHWSVTNIDYIAVLAIGIK